MPRSFLSPNTVVYRFAPAAEAVVLRDVQRGGPDALAGCRHRDERLGLDFPIHTTRSGRAYYEPEAAPFLAMQRLDVDAALRALVHGVPPDTLGGHDGVRVDGHAAPFLVAAVYQEAWSDAQLERLMLAAASNVGLPEVTHQQRSLLDHALRQGRWALAETLWAHGVRWTVQSLAQGEPLWNVLLCSFGQWAVLHGEAGCTTPQAAEHAWARMTQPQAASIMRAVRPTFDRWVDRALEAGADVNVLRRLTGRERVNGPAHTLITSVLGYGLLHARRNCFNDAERIDLARHLTVRFLRAGADPNVALRWEAQAPIDLVAYAQVNGLSEAGVLIEQRRLRTEPLTAATGARARARL